MLPAPKDLLAREEMLPGPPLPLRPPLNPAERGARAGVEIEKESDGGL